VSLVRKAGTSRERRRGRRKWLHPTRDDTAFADASSAMTSEGVPSCKSFAAKEWKRRGGLVGRNGDEGDERRRRRTKDTGTACCPSGSARVDEDRVVEQTRRR
jgi:hypothetical protein